MVSVLYATSLDPNTTGGIQTLIRNQVSGLRDLGHNIHVLDVSPSNKRKLSDFIPKRRYLRTQDNFPPEEYLRYAYYNYQERKISDFLADHKIDIVHAGMIRCLPALYISDVKDIPSVVSTHALELGNRRLAKAALSMADLVHCVSQYTKGLVDHANPELETRQMPPSLDIASYKEITDSAKYSGDIICMSRLVKRKNISTVIEAYSMLSDSLKNEIGLHILGDGPERDKIERLSSSIENVEVHGYVSNKEKKKALAAGELFVLTPIKRGFDVEGFGIVWIEAQAAGTPVVGSCYGGAPESIGTHNVIVNQPENPAKVSHAVHNTITNPSKEQDIRDHVERFAIDAVAEELAEIYQSLI